MADEPKVVEGGEVTFEGGVSQPDALSPPAAEVVVQPSEIVCVQMDPGVYGALVQYLNHVTQLIQNERKLAQSPWTHLSPIAPYLRFESDMGVIATGVPKPTFLSFIEQENPTLAQLLTTTDLGEELPDPCTIGQLPEMVKALGYQRELQLTREFNDLQNVINGRIDIPWGYFVSLLITEGAIYRKFLQHSGQATTNSYIWGERRSLTIATVSPLVSPEALEKFVRETGESHVAGFVKDLQSLDHSLRILISEGRPGNIIDALYSRLKQYHPELTV